MDRERLVDLAIALALTAWMLAEVWAEQLAPLGGGARLRRGGHRSDRPAVAADPRRRRLRRRHGRAGGRRA
jgi:hypothetical protein